MNAIKFTYQDGKIAIICKYDHDESQLQISVQDNGIGLSEEVKTRIFSMFKALTLRSNKGGKEGGLYGGPEDNSK